MSQGVHHSGERMSIEASFNQMSILGQTHTISKLELVFPLFKRVTLISTS